MRDAQQLRRLPCAACCATDGGCVTTRPMPAARFADSLAALFDVLLLVPSISRGLLTVVAVCGRVAIMSASSSTWVFTSEVYPTSVRGTGHAASFAVARVAGASATCVYDCVALCCVCLCPCLCLCVRRVCVRAGERGEGWSDACAARCPCAAFLTPYCAQARDVTLVIPVAAYAGINLVAALAAWCYQKVRCAP